MLAHHVRPSARRSSRRASSTSIASLLALTLAAGTTAIAGCSAGPSTSADAPQEATAQATSALSSGGGLFAVAGSQLEQGSVGGAFTPAGDAYGVTALAGFHGQLYVASGDELWMRGAIGPGTGNDWTHVGAAHGAVAMTYHRGQLYMVAQNQLWQRSAVTPGVDWTAVGDAYGVTAMASFAGQLYVASGNALWQRGAIGPGTGNDWSYAGDAYGVTAMASYGGHLYVVSNNQLWQRGLIGPGTGNTWTLAGSAPSITALTSLPVDCTAGFSAADCPSPSIDLTGLADVAIGHPAKQSSTLAGQTPDRAVDADVTTAAATNVEPSPWISVDLGFDRQVKAVGISTDTANVVVDLLDATGTVVFSEPIGGFTSSQGMYLVGISPVTARTVRVRASSPTGGVSLNVREVQVFASLLPPGVTREPPTGTCWKSTYGRGAGAPISACDADQDEDGALCYPKCASGFYGVGPVCWQACPAGWTDTGAFCHLDGSIIGADNSACPWYDECGLTFAQGCSTCPAGYYDDGCTCRIDPQDFAKQSYGRGAGTPLHCAANQEEQAALCYTPCSGGYDGVGPVCWSECHGDFSVACGSLACASSADACTGFIQEAVDSTVNFAVTVASLFGPSASFETIGFAFSIANAVQIKGVNALTQEIANLIIAASEHTPLSGGGTISQDLANTTAGAIVTALQTGKINWSLIDPTGIAAVIAAFDHPTC